MLLVRGNTGAGMNHPHNFNPSVIKIRQYLRKLCSNEKGPVFLTHSAEQYDDWYSGP